MEIKKRGLLKKALNPFRVTFDQRGGVSRKSVQCIKVTRDGDNYVIRYKDAKNLLCTMELPTSEWTLRGEAEILFDEPVAAPIPISSGKPAPPSKDPYAKGRIDPRTGKQVVPFVETPGNLEKTVGEKEYNALDKDNWQKPPATRLPFSAHVESNFSVAESNRRAQVSRHRAEIIDRAEHLGSGWGVDQ